MQCIIFDSISKALHLKKCLNCILACYLNLHTALIVNLIKHKKSIKSIIKIYLIQNTALAKKIFFDRDALRSGPTIHFVGFVNLVQNLLQIHGNMSFILGTLRKPP